MDIASIRKDYQFQSLDIVDVASSPFQQFGKWWEEAISSDIDEVNAMTLATVDEHARPSARIVLLKGFDEQGFVFFTNYQSNKGKALSLNPLASLVFFWKELERQVRIDGTCIRVSEEESDVYFQSRPLGSKLGAWASPQSSVISNRSVIENELDAAANRYADGNVPRPSHWGGYRVIPDAIEFWQGRPSRLHDRLKYIRSSGEWRIERLAP
jgi:pyridoxamine 5'-phosphate oxidase